MGLLYTKMKVFRYREKLDSLPPGSAALLPPIHLRIKPTNVCNHSCSYCAYRSGGTLQLGKDMQTADSIPRRKMLEIVEDAVAMGVRAVTFSGGGEPFCYPHLAEAVRALAGGPIAFAALTNGSRLAGEIAELFAHRGTWVRVSIDGWDDESYARYRGVRLGEYSRVMRNMEAFKRLAGGCTLGVSLIVDRENASHIYETIRRVRETGADSVKVSPCIVSNDGGEVNAYQAPVQAAVRDQIRRAAADMGNGAFEIFDAYHEQDRDYRKSYRWCPYLQILPVIGADQNVYSCQDKAYNLENGLLGSIRDRRFRDFWFDGPEKFHRIDPSRACDHHCVADAKNRLIHEYLGADRDHLGFV